MMVGPVDADDNLLDVSNLAVRFRVGDAEINAVRRVDLLVAQRSVLGIIGESGSGKSVTGLALMGLLPANTQVSADRLHFAGRHLLGLREHELRSLRGTRLAMIFQDPVGAFNPAKSISWHLDRVIARGTERAGRSNEQLQQDAHQWLLDVGIPDPERVLPLYPHQLSGGMLQRTLIALNAALQPELLIADEPTTNLDNIVERQIVGLFRRLRDKLGTALIFITHDISLAADICDHIAVMYAGEIVEVGPAEQIMKVPSHPYTQGLIAMARQLGERGRRLTEIPGELPSTARGASGCLFAARCGRVSENCRAASPPPVAVGDGHSVRCIHHG